VQSTSKNQLATDLGTSPAPAFIRTAFCICATYIALLLQVAAWRLAVGIRRIDQAVAIIVLVVIAHFRSRCATSTLGIEELADIVKVVGKSAVHGGVACIVAEARPAATASPCQLSDHLAACIEQRRAAAAAFGRSKQVMAVDEVAPWPAAAGRPCGLDLVFRIGLGRAAGMTDAEQWRAICKCDWRAVPAEEGASMRRRRIQRHQRVIGLLTGIIDRRTQGSEFRGVFIEQLVAVGLAAGRDQLEKGLHVPSIIAPADAVVGGQEIRNVRAFVHVGNQAAAADVNPGSGDPLHERHRGAGRVVRVVRVEVGAIGIYNALMVETHLSR
jgi:hypothetical protein